MVTFFELFSPSNFACSIVVSLLPLLFIAWIVNYRVRNNENKSRARPPEAGGAWPIIGHLHLLGRKGLPHKVLAQMADKYGPIFSLRIGMRKALVVSSWEMAKECLISNDKAVASRPRLIAIEVMVYGDANFAFIPSGPYWSSIRKLLTLGLLSNHRIDMMSYVWKEEINASMSKLYEFWFKNKKSTGSGSGSDVVLVDLKKCILELLMSISVRIISGKNYAGCGEEVLRLHKTFKDFTDKVAAFLIADALPFLRWLDLGGQEKAMKKTAQEMDDLLESWLREHKQKRSSGSTTGDEGFIDVMLSFLDESQVINDSGYDPDTINKATCLMLLIAAADPSSVVLTWAISLLLSKRHVMEKAKDELSIHVGKDRLVDESDIPKLVYIQAIVKETLRMYPPGALGGPREFTEDCIVAGYHVKKGTRLIVNLSRIQRDPQVWEDPMEFRPERFLTTHKDVDVRGQNFELIPFGAGRRICPGLAYGLRSAHLTLANFLHGFELSMPPDAPVDMTESSGLTNLKETPLEVLIAPRLSAHLYDQIAV